MRLCGISVFYLSEDIFTSYKIFRKKSLVFILQMKKSLIKYVWYYKQTGQIVFTIQFKSYTTIYIVLEIVFFLLNMARVANIFLPFKAWAHQRKEMNFLKVLKHIRSTSAKIFCIQIFYLETRTWTDNNLENATYQTSLLLITNVARFVK